MRAFRSLLLAASLAAIATAAKAEPATIKAQVIEAFEVGTQTQQFGRLRFIGGLALTSDNPLFGAWSSVRFLPDGQHFIGVFDTAHWLQGRIERDARGRLAGLADVTIVPMREKSGQTDTAKWLMDAEGMALSGGDILVSFENRHRIDVYPGGDLAQAVPKRSLPMLIPPDRLRHNGGIEAMAVAPDTPGAGPLAGSAVIVSEYSLDDAGNLQAAILDGPLRGRFSVTRHDGFDVTDSAFLPDGDLLLLERRFTWATGVAMRIRRIPGRDLRPGAVVDGEELLRAGMQYQIDNMEGMDVMRGPDGSTRIILVSDDNHFVIQRTLMLEFELLPE